MSLNPNPRILDDRKQVIPDRLNRLLASILSAMNALVGLPAGGSTGQVLTKSSNADYDATWAAAAAGTTAPSTNPAGRLTLTSGSPLPLADVTGATNVYWTPYKGNTVQLWDGAAWTTYAFSEITLPIGTLAGVVPQDVFARQVAGVVTLDLLAWTSATARATAITIQDGRYCKSGDKTRLYLGSFMPTSTTTTEDSGGGVTTQVGGKRMLFNHYNQEPRSCAVFDSSASYNYSNATFRQVNAAAGNKIGVMVGVPTNIDAVAQSYMVSTVACNVGVGIGIDNAFSTSAQISGTGAPASAGLSLFAHLRGQVGAGYHDIIWLEMGFGSGTQSWFNASGVANQIKTGLIFTANI